MPQEGNTNFPLPLGTLPPPGTPPLAPTATNAFTATGEAGRSGQAWSPPSRRDTLRPSCSWGRGAGGEAVSRGCNDQASASLNTYPSHRGKQGGMEWFCILVS